MSVHSPSWDALLLAAVGLLAGLAGSARGRGRAWSGGVVLALALAGLRLALANAGGYAALPRSFLIVTAALVLLSVTLLLAALRTGAEPAPPPLVPPLPAPGMPVLAWVHAVAVVVALVVPSFHLFFGAMLLAAIAGWFVPGRGWFRPVPLLAILVLLVTWYFVARVAGPDLLRLAMLGEAPFSTAFELAAAAGLLGLAWVLLGLAPFHLMRRGSLTPILGGALLVRLVATAVPGGLVHWQPVAYPVVALTGLVAAVQRQRRLAALVLAATALLSGDPGAGWGGVVLLGVSLALDGEALLERRGVLPPGRGRLARGALTALGGLMLVPVLAAGLAAEMVYTTVIALLAALALARDCTR